MPPGADAEPAASRSHGQDPLAAVKGLAREPLVHFFLVGALLFLAHRLVRGDARTIRLGPGQAADLARHLRDQNGRIPTPAEQAAALAKWKLDEALYREALREGVDRDDPDVRTVLVDKMRARAMAAAPRRVPTEGELATWLQTHQALYERPLQYDLAWIPFPKATPGAARERASFAAALKSGAEARFLGRPLYEAKLTTDDLRTRFGPAVAAEVSKLARGSWQPLESDAELLLVRVGEVEGGLPDDRELRPRLLIDWTAEAQRLAAEQTLEAIARRYRFEERR